MTRDAFDQFTPPDRGRFGDNETRDAKGPRVTGASNLVDLDLYLHNDNPAKKAIAVSYAADTAFEKWTWLPRSLIEVEKKSTRTVRVTMPEHVAHEKGLI